MKDAFGGSFMLYIMMIFFVIFICFMTVAINFARTFRIKNTAINYIERYAPSSLDDAVSQIDGYLSEVLYKYPNSPSVQSHCNGQGGTLTANGVCIVSIDGGSYYKVFAYIVMDFPMFDAGIAIPIGGETKIINHLN